MKQVNLSLQIPDNAVVAIILMPLVKAHRRDDYDADTTGETVPESRRESQVA